MKKLKNTTKTPITDDPLFAPVLFREHFINWLNKYFERVDKVFEYKSKNKGVYYTKEQIFQTYEKVMLEPPFK